MPNNNKGQRGQRRKQKSNKSEPDKEKKFCGGSWYNKLECPARTEGVVCKVCKTQGHFGRACLHPDAGKSTMSKTPLRKVKACESSDENSSDMDEFFNKISASKINTDSSDDESDVEDVVRFIKKTSGNKQVHQTIT